MANPNTPKIDPERAEAMNPEAVLDYMAEIGQSLAINAVEIKAMLAEAKEKNIPVDISTFLAPFRPLGDYEKQLVIIRGKLGSIKGEMFKQGIQITQDNMRARLQKIGMGTPELPRQESLNDPALFDLYRQADDIGKYQRSLEYIKNVAKEIASKLYELGTTNLPYGSKLGEAYLLASKVKESYQDVEQAESAMKRIASLISESDGFQNASEKWEQKQG